MGLTVTLMLDDETGTYLGRLAADRGRTPDEVASWLVTEELRRERAIDAELLADLDDAVDAARGRADGPRPSRDDAARRERAGA